MAEPVYSSCAGSNSVIVQRETGNTQATPRQQATRRTVISSLYRRWRCKARYLSTLRAVTVKIENEHSVHDKNSVIESRIPFPQLSFEKYRVNFHAMYRGWTIRPTKRSDTARPIKITLDGEISEGFLANETKTSEFPTTATKQNGMFRAALMTKGTGFLSIFLDVY